MIQNKKNNIKYSTKKSHNKKLTQKIISKMKIKPSTKPKKPKIKELKEIKPSEAKILLKLSNTTQIVSNSIQPCIKPMGIEH